MSDLDLWMADRRGLVEAAMDRLLPAASLAPTRLHEAMRYSVSAGGKRIRPLLVIAAAEACGSSAASVMPAACALECIHTYSLIHDDLPCMDDDDLRRGRPTNHKVFGETMAVLAGDALQAHAFKLMADNARIPGVDPMNAALAAAIVAEAASSLGMVGGQAADWLAEGRVVSEDDVLFIHRHKTGALIRASVLAGAVLAGADGAKRAALTGYGEGLGLLFQIVDDVLNIEGDPAKLGKAVGSDAAHGKATFPAVAGLEKSKRRASTLLAETKAAIGSFNGQAGVLSGIADLVLTRNS